LHWLPYKILQFCGRPRNPERFLVRALSNKICSKDEKGGKQQCRKERGDARDDKEKNSDD